LSQGGDVPLAAADLVNVPLLCFFRRHPEGLVEQSVRGDNPEPGIEHHEGLPYRVHDAQGSGEVLFEYLGPLPGVCSSCGRHLYPSSLKTVAGQAFLKQWSSFGTVSSFIPLSSKDRKQLHGTGSNGKKIQNELSVHKLYLNNTSKSKKEW
jgi:hypothetical protein